ncbi:MAG: hypothetical protein ACJAUO_000451 [Sediminicola sp.]|jgi:hypothetical protein
MEVGSKNALNKMAFTEMVIRMSIINAPNLLANKERPARISTKATMLRVLVLIKAEKYSFAAGDICPMGIKWSNLLDPNTIKKSPKAIRRTKKIFGFIIGGLCISCMLIYEKIRQPIANFTTISL